MNTWCSPLHGRKRCFIAFQSVLYSIIPRASNLHSSSTNNQFSSRLKQEKKKKGTYSSSASVKRNRLITAAAGGLWGNSDTLKKGRNLLANLAISLWTKATDCFFADSTSVAANVFLDCCWSDGDLIVLGAERGLLTISPPTSWWGSGNNGTLWDKAS